MTMMICICGMTSQYAEVRIDPRQWKVQSALPPIHKLFIRNLKFCLESNKRRLLDHAKKPFAPSFKEQYSHGNRA